MSLPDPEATMEAGRRLAAALAGAGDLAFLFCLRGPLGAGKTTLCQGFAEAMGAGPADSPTFALCNLYGGEVPISHLDLYRLGPDAAGEFLGAGLDEFLDGLCLVEWPERLGDDFWPEKRRDLFFLYEGDGRSLRARGEHPLAATIWRRARGGA
jgi:tRNA threonylcarbamoyl adenosine modification protein YjeE